MSEVSEACICWAGQVAGIIQLSDAIVEKTAYIYRRAQERGLIKTGRCEQY